MGGGDLLNLLIERDVFEEDFTRFYVAEVRRSHFTYRFAMERVIPRWSLPSNHVTNLALFIVILNLM